MTTSLLSQKISLCQLIENVENEECLDVIQAIGNECGWDMIKKWLIKCIVSTNDLLDYESLENIVNETKESISNKSKRKNIKCGSGSNKCHDDEHEEALLLFRLLKLPIDIIEYASLYLNETDIFRFERCNRLFYQMINKLSYLSKCNNFKYLWLGEETLDECRFKYSQADKLSICCPPAEKDKFSTFFLDSINHDWLTHICQSIKHLDIGVSASYPSRHLPMNILFDEKESNLQEITFQDVDGDDGIAPFNHSYMDCEYEFEWQRKKMRLLKRVNIKNTDGYAGWSKFFLHSLNYIDTIHLHVSNCTCKIDPDYDSCGFSSSMKKLTFNWVCWSINNNNDHDNNGDSDSESDDDEENSINTPADDGTGIETLEISTHIGDWSSMLSSHYKLLFCNTLNLSNTLKTLTFYFEPRNRTSIENVNPFAFLESVLDKKYFYKLEDVNILACIDMNESTMNDFFGILTKRIDVLKYQFKQLIIGLCCSCESWENNDEQLYYFTFKWNNKIDEKFLQQIQDNCLTGKQSANENVKHKTMFQQLSDF